MRRASFGKLLALAHLLQDTLWNCLGEAQTRGVS